MKSFVAKQEEVTRKWYLVDAADKPAGRLAVEITKILRGKNKPTFTPHVDTGDFVVVINAEKVKLSGTKEQKKIYKDYSGYPNGLKEYPASDVRAKHPDRIVRQAVRGMMPKNRQSRSMMRRLHVYTGTNHPHVAQQPESIELI